MLGVLPPGIAFAAARAFEAFPGDIYELRLIGGQCAFLVTSAGIRFLSADGGLSGGVPRMPLTVGRDEPEELVERAIGYSGFAHEEELKQSFLTRADGTRIGIAYTGGTGSLKTGRVASVNIRLPVRGAAFDCPALDALLRELPGGVLVAGGPNTGKTTLLRYCCRYLAGGLGGVYRKVCAVDERMELAGGGEAFDLGVCTDVISGRSKREAILTALRLLSPEVIVCDEIGSCRETESILEGLNSGVTFIASMHARDLPQLARRGQFLRLFEENVFSFVVMLSPAERGKIASVYSYDEVADEIHRNGRVVLRGGADRVLREYPETAACRSAAKAV
ncbi:MAG: stage III sporulation protein AA [Clostridia bacterium]|nr:stage III sporulation protein AA [Clostridia bacterium]